ncbi:MAG: rRNA pseudouridine synthase [Actinobacteria bacterium]|nr:rRNA pseudouridine synthase [Actinomycetota bacterium]MBM3714057.1 rRNA pseudouridine synthase [Actinomycetota bacterium]
MIKGEKEKIVPRREKTTVPDKKSIYEKKLRIAKYLAACGLASRRKCEELILNEKIRVNKKIVKDLAYRVSNNDVVEYNGKILKLKENIVIALNKPAGYISTTKDDFERKTVLDLINEKNIRLFPVGRLDTDSRGLMLLTNDGELAYRILHPKFQVSKIYEVTIEEKITDTGLKELRRGIKIENRRLTPLNLRILKTDPYSTLLEINITEGRKRIIRKAFKKLGYKVLDLKRTQIGNFRLKNLREGSYRTLSKKEINSILEINSIPES